MIAIFGLIAAAIFRFGRPNGDIPLAPYNLKLYCRNGQSNIPETRILSLCPTSTTSCGYFEFETLSSPGNGDEPLGIYECVDSSILMSDNDDNEEEKQMLFSNYCDDQARCRTIMLASFNAKFVQYLAQRGHVKAQKLLATRVKFCCAINDPLLQKIIRSGDHVLPVAAPLEPVECNGVRCRGAPVGCLTYSRHNETEQSEEEEVIFVQPVHINYDDYTVITPQPVNNKYMMKYTAEYHCVYRHFNDEHYRYCLLVHDQPSKDHCYYGDGYQICCCFLHRDESTCDPLSTAPELMTTTEAPETPTSKSTISLRSYTTSVATKLRTRCRAVFEMRSESSRLSVNGQRHKKLLCDTDVITTSSCSTHCCYYLLLLCSFIANYFCNSIVW